MVRNRKRTTDRQSWDRTKMAMAIRDVVKKGITIHSAAKKYGLPEATFRRYVKNYNGPGDDLDEIKMGFPENAGRYKKTFTPRHKMELKAYITDIDKRAFGLTRAQFGKICFDFAESLGIYHRFNSDKKVAGRDFIRDSKDDFGLTFRPPHIPLGTPSTFDKINAAKFFNVLRELRMKYSFHPSSIYNVDEIKLSTVPSASPKVISPIREHSVLNITSADQEKTVTCVCAMNPLGNFIPPFFIFPREEMDTSFLQGAPPDSHGIAQESGLMTSENFVAYLHHFAKFSQPSVNNPVLLLMDNYASYMTLEAMLFCNDNYIHILGFPAHTSHKLQPLHIAFLGPLKLEYSSICDTFNHLGCSISTKNICEIFGKAYSKVATSTTAANGFEATGIEPFDSTIFEDEDFSDSTPSNISIVEVVGSAREAELHGENTIVFSDESTETPLCFTLVPQDPEPILNLPPLSKATKKKRGRKPKKPKQELSVLHTTGTPFTLASEIKKEDEEMEECKAQLLKLTELCTEPKQTKDKKTIQCRLMFSSSNELEVAVEYTDPDSHLDNEKDCIICEGKGETDLCYQCYQCKLWVHKDCSGWDEMKAFHRPYKCDFCL